MGLISSLALLLLAGHVLATGSGTKEVIGNVIAPQDNLQKFPQGQRSELESRKTFEEHIQQFKDILERWRSHKCGLRMGEWLPASNGELPNRDHSIVAGWDPAVWPYWVGRVRSEGHVVPCKLTAVHKTCWMPWNNTEINMKNYEVLTNADVKWVAHSSDKVLPVTAMPAGYINHPDGSKELLYVGRDVISNMLVPGYVYQRSRVLRHSSSFVNEIKTSYELLVYI